MVTTIHLKPRLKRLAESLKLKVQESTRIRASSSKRC